MLIAPFLAVLLVFQGQQPPAKPALDKVMAKVNGTPLTAADIEPYLWDWRANEVVEDLVLLQIAQQAAAKAGIALPQAELDDRVKKELTQLQAGNYDPQKLKEQGFPMSRIVLKIQTALLLEKITLAKFKPEEWAQVSTIDFKAENSSLMTWGKVSKQANDTYAQLQKGVLWEKVKPQDAQADHWVPVGSLVPEIGAKVKTAVPGTVFPPRQNGQAIELTRLAAWGGRISQASLNDLRAFYIQQNRNETLNKLKQEAKVERTPLT